MVNRTIEYIIVDAPMFPELTKKVNDKLKEGYVPLGGLATILISPPASSFFQAMIKESEMPQVPSTPSRSTRPEPPPSLF